MAYIASLVLPFMACVLVVVISSALWWRSLSSPYAYASFALLAMLALHRLLQAAAELFKFFTHGGYFLEYQQRPEDFAHQVERHLTVEALLISLALVLLGWPLSRLLRARFSR